MGYLSCKAESSISTADSQYASSASSSSKSSEKEKPIKIQEFNYKDLELATNNFSDTKLLGRGSHGLVYKGVLRNGRLVAIKKPSQKIPISDNPNEVDNEIDILSKLQSPRLVNLVGFTNNNSQNRLLVVEFMSKGTLYDVLHLNSRPPNWGRRIKLALQTAKAIETLHSLNPPVIHRDIKSANVLIDRNFNARLGDFGLALRCVDDYRLRSTPPAVGERLLIWEIRRLGCRLGYSLIKRGKLLNIYDPRVLPPKDVTVRKMLAVVAAKCVRSCRERRPSMKEVVECLSELSKMVPIHSWNGFANPCLMVENVGRPVQSRGVGGENGNLDDVDVKNGRPLRNPGRVYSDLGFRSNLMELMDGDSKFCHEDDGVGCKLESAKRASSLRFEIGRLAERTNIRSMVLGDGKNRVSNLKPNRSVGESSDKFSEIDGKVTGSSSVTQAVDLTITSEKL
ncbi:hypothetical protein DH2020_025847 [Rehmannia glutinosa]|uniref:Protein kinase domain-containing protein n=1 Tax=Rehmannia glutinosa TaxID=99300 RepID=A0ABR0VYQ7_REHGL